MDLKLPLSIKRMVSDAARKAAQTYPRNDEVWGLIPTSNREIGSLVERIDDDRIFIFSPSGEFLGEVEARGTVHLHGSPDHPQTSQGRPVFESANDDSILMRVEVDVGFDDDERYERVTIYTPAPFTHQVMVLGPEGQEIHSSWHTPSGAHRMVHTLITEGKCLEGDAWVAPFTGEV